MAITGAGLQYAGTSSSGYGDPGSATGIAGVFLRDTLTGKSFGARRINPSTRDFEMDTNGRVLGRNYVQAAVQMCVHTVHQSSADGSLGHRLGSIDRIRPNFERVVESILREALSPLIIRGLVEVIAFQDGRKGNGRNGLLPGAIYGRLLWRDLTTGQEHTEGV